MAMRCVRRSARRSPRPRSQEDPGAFYNSLSEDLSQLEQSLSGGPASLRWAAEAMKIVKKMQVEQLDLFKNSELVFSPGDAAGGRLDEYMKTSIAALDLCNSIKLAVSRMNRYRITVDFVIRKLVSNGSNCAVHEALFKTVEFEPEGLENDQVAVRAGRSGGEEKSMASVMLSLFGFPELRPLVGAAAPGGLGAVVAEREIVGRLVADIWSQVVGGAAEEGRFLSSVELLRSGSAELGEGIEKLDAAVDEVFEAVMRGRNEVLGVIRDRSLYMNNTKDKASQSNYG